MTRSGEERVRDEEEDFFLVFVGNAEERRWPPQSEETRPRRRHRRSSCCWPRNRLRGNNRSSLRGCGLECEVFGTSPTGNRRTWENVRLCPGAAPDSRSRLAAVNVKWQIRGYTFCFFTVLTPSHFNNSEDAADAM